MRESAPTLRAKALEVLRSEAMTADEIAGRLNRSVLAIRPRVTELFKMGKIEDTGQRRANASGRRAVVWRAR
jgi:predicted ArsR family transcriptional regulator